MRRAPFIVFEGPEGAGKSGQIARVAERVRAVGRSCVVTREPGGTPIGEQIRAHLLRPGLDVPAVTELLLFAAQRSAHVDIVVEPALARGELVLSDRYALSTRIYQGVARGLDPDLIARTTAIATGGLEPDLYVILDVDPEVGRSRQAATGELPDRIESEDRNFMERVRSGYRAYAATHDHATLVDAGDSHESVAGRVDSLLESRFPEWFRAEE